MISFHLGPPGGTFSGPVGGVPGGTESIGGLLGSGFGGPWGGLGKAGGGTGGLAGTGLFSGAPPTPGGREGDIGTAISPGTGSPIVLATNAIVRPVAAAISATEAVGCAATYIATAPWGVARLCLPLGSLNLRGSLRTYS